MQNRIHRLTRRLLLAGALPVKTLPDFILADDATMTALELAAPAHSPKARSDAWFKALSKRQQQAYIKKHPNSRFAKLYKKLHPAAASPKTKGKRAEPKSGRSKSKKLPVPEGLSAEEKKEPPAAVKFKGSEPSPFKTHKRPKADDVDHSTPVAPRKPSLNRNGPYDPDNPEHQRAWPPKGVKPGDWPSKDQYTADMKARGIKANIRSSNYQPSDAGITPAPAAAPAATPTEQYHQAPPEAKTEAADRLRSGETRHGHPLKAYLRQKLSKHLGRAASGVGKLASGEPMTKQERNSLLKLSFAAVTAVGALGVLGVSGGNVAAAFVVKDIVRELFEHYQEQRDLAERRRGDDDEEEAAVRAIGPDMAAQEDDGWLDEWLGALANQIEGKHDRA